MRRNPFALIKASDFSDEQINSLWVELGPTAIDQIIEPREPLSKFILGGKGAGKTHLLRYHSYPVAKLRERDGSGLSMAVRQGYIAVFLRATGIDAARFEASSVSARTWQHLFAIYLELRLAELVVDTLCDMESSSPTQEFDFEAFVSELRKSVSSSALDHFESMPQLRSWITKERRLIDDAINAAAFTGELKLLPPFSIGSLCIPLGRSLSRWHASLAGVPLIYMLDEIENFSEPQQEVVNTLIRYGEGHATFRVSGRLYSMETFATLGNGEVNRDGAEYRITKLDEIMRGLKGYPTFAKAFITKRLASVLMGDSPDSTKSQVVDPLACFDDIEKSDFYMRALERYANSESAFSTTAFEAALSEDPVLAEIAFELVQRLVRYFPPLIAKLNILLFCKKLGAKRVNPVLLAETLHTQARVFVEQGSAGARSYSVAYDHWAGDLFAQMCDESDRQLGVPYCGFSNFVKMSSGNPRSLLIILGRAYEVASFRGEQFTSGIPLSVPLQTEAALDAAHFMFESDTNFGSKSERARQATLRLGDLLRTARYSLNIPEVSPIAVSFADDELSAEARRTLLKALNYSFIFEVADGRPDRNSKRLNRKIQLNPILSPKWQLPISRRGDISLSAELVNAIFDHSASDNFEGMLRALRNKWNYPFSRHDKLKNQPGLFP